MSLPVSDKSVATAQSKTVSTNINFVNPSIMRKYSILSLLFIVIILCMFSLDNYSQVGGEWTELQPEGSIPVGTAGHTAIYRSITNEMVVVGGNPTYIGYYLDQNHSYNIITNLWEILPPFPVNICYHSAIYDPLNDRMLVFGGLNDNLVLNTLYEFNFSTNQWSLLNTSGNIPSPRYFHSGAYNSVSHSMIIYGGKYYGCNETYILDLNTYVWELVIVSGDLPDETKHQSAIYDPINENLIVFGGEEYYHSYKNDTYVLGLNSGVWSHMDTTNVLPRSSHCCRYISSAEQMVIFGGQNNNLGIFFNDTWFYDPQFDTWQLMDTSGVIPSPSTGGTFVSIENMTENFLLLYGGYNGSHNNELWKLEYDIVLPIYSETSANSIITCPDNPIITIDVVNISNVTDFSLTLNYDTTNISYLGYQNFNTQLNNDSLAVTDINGEITMSWNSTSPITILSDTLIELLFTVTNVFNQNTEDLIWDETISYYMDSTGAYMAAVFNAGQISINPIPANTGLIMGANSICQGASELIYTIDSIPNANTYNWSLIPDTAGVIIGSDTIITINFSDSFYGEATLSVYGSNTCGDGIPSSLNINVIGLPISNAGGDNEICEDESYTLLGSASNCTHIYWNSLGDGSFDDPFLLNATYTPGPVDIQTGLVDLVLYAYAISPCLGEVGDTMTLIIEKAPFVVAGENTEICEGDSILLSGDAVNYSSILWITSGDGTYNDPGILTPTYNPGANDISSGDVNLILTAYPNLPCLSEEADTLALIINNYPVQPHTPEGPITIDLDATQTSDYTINQVTNATSYEWFLEPSEAGIIEGVDTIGTVYWSSGYVGLSAYVHVVAINDCGEVVSDTLGISVSPVSVSELIIKEPEINISPNPASNRITINTPNQQNAYLELTNLNGQMVLISNPGDMTISLESLPSGLYIATIKHDNTVVARDKLIVR